MIRLLPLALPLVESLLAILLCVAPGWVVARRATGDRLTRLLVAVLASYFIFHLIALTSYAFDLPLQAGPLASLAVSAAAAGAIYFEPERRRDFASSFHVEGMLVWWAVAWFALGLQAALVGCGAGSWGNDWHEHYARSMLFAEHGSPSTTFSATQWTVPARGPLFNSVCAIFLGLFGREFWNYQVFSTVLNTTTVLAIAMALRDFAGIRERSALLMSAIFCALSPFAVTEIAYPWTKLLTVAYILCALRFLLVSLDARGQTAPLLWSSFLFALGILTHFYVAIPAALCGLYYVAVLRGTALRPATLAAGLAALIVAPWIVYCFVTFGVAGTFGANSTVRAAQAAGPPYARVVAENLLSSTFPVSVRHRFSFAQSHTPVLLSADASGRWTAKEEEQDDLTIWMLDLINGNFSILGSLGLAGMFAILLAAVTWDRCGRAGPSPPPPLAGPTSFWVFLLAGGVILTVMSYPRYADNGLRGAGLHVYIVLMAVLAVRQVRAAPRGAAIALAALFLIESAIGSGAYIGLLSREVPMRMTDAGVVGLPGGAVDPLYIKNYAEKLRAGLVFLSDYLGQGRLPFSLSAIVCSLGLFARVAMRADEPESEVPAGL